ncbi:MAG: prepilin-type N-terminal cleavage/methylation domain-containing protein [Patescibacteria group bacterium]|jgi:Tfp pilus assembly protein PilW
MSILNKKGFTLVELIIYISLASLILLAITGFFQLHIASRVKNKTITEVEQQGVQILNLISQYVVNASAIDSPATGVSSSNLSLQMPTVASNPTIFSFSGGNLYITEGASSPVVLNSSSVEITNINFTNLSKSNTPGIIRVEFTLDYVSNSSRPEFKWSKTFYTSVSLR